MKKVAVVLLLLASSSSLFAQRKDKYGIPVHSLDIQVADALVSTVATGIGVGLGTAIGAGIAAVISGGHATIQAPKFTGWLPYLSAGYEYHFPDSRWSLGPEAGYWHYGLVSGETYQHLHLATIAAAGKFYYKPSGVCKLYGGLNLGAGLFFSTTSKVAVADRAEEEGGSVSSSGGGGASLFPALQFNPIGMRLGGGRVAFIAELGIGYRGILQLGVNVGL